MTAPFRDRPPELTQSDPESNELDLTPAFVRAGRGLRSDVQALIDVLPQGSLHVPLSHSIPNVPLTERVEVGDSLTLSPHLIVDEDGDPFCAFFTRAEGLQRFAATLGWRTDAGPLEICTLPAVAAWEVAVELADGNPVLGLVVNPGSEGELVLNPLELGSIAQKQAIPLVGYVQDIPADDDVGSLVSELETPPEPELVAAIERSIARFESIAGYQLQQTFNRERDIDPHLTLKLVLRAEVDREAIGRSVFDGICEFLPPPGYIDVVFVGVDAPSGNPP